MTNQEAIENLKLLRGFKNDLKKKQYDQYTAKRYEEEVEALDMAIAALEKQEPVLVQYGKCPICRNWAKEDMDFCDKCGQAIKWR